jgi:hypothetical protein
MAQVQPLSGDSAAAAAEADAVERASPGYVRIAYERALICAALRDRDGLLSWLRRLRHARFVVFWGLRNDILLAEFASDPGFIAAAAGALTGAPPA